MNSFGTIVARNYLHHARLLATSFRTHHPSDTFTCLVTDAVPGQTWGDESLDSDERMRILTPAGLPLPREQFNSMAYMYDVIELATALKPFLLQELLNSAGGACVATYLDPDTFVYSHVPDVSESAPEIEALLTPHRLSPPPFDDGDPQEHLFLRHGAYNLGYLSVRPGHELLSWWGERLTVDSVVSHPEGLFTDQKWMDLAPTYFRVEQLRHPGVNVAWWNLDERLFERDGDQVTVGGQPLVLAHFSGYRVGRPPYPVRTKNGGSWLSSRQIFEALAEEYLTAVQTAQSGIDRQAPYGFGLHEDGQPITRYQRRRYRQVARAQYLSQGDLPFAPWAGRGRTDSALATTFEHVDAWVGRRLPWETIESKVRRRTKRAADRVRGA